MGAISGGPEKFGIKNNFSSTPPSNLNYDWSLKADMYTGDKILGKHIRQFLHKNSV